MNDPQDGPSWSGPESEQHQRRGRDQPSAGGARGGQWPDLSTFRPGVIPLGPLGVGEIFGGAFATLRAHPGMLFGSAFLVIAISQLLALLLTWPRMQELTAMAGVEELTQGQAQSLMLDSLFVSGITFGFAMLAQLFVAGLATVVVGKAVLGQPVGFAEAWEELKPRLLPLLGLTMLVGIVVFAGAMLFLIPGIWAYVLLALATPALVLERSSVLQAMRRSKDLVQNSWWRIFGILLLTAMIVVGINIIVSTPFELIAGGSAAGGLEAGATTGEFMILSTIGPVLAGTIAYPFTASVHALIYIDRRIRTEGLAVELARAAGMAPPDAGPPGTPHSW